MISRFRRLLLLFISATLLALPFHFGALWPAAFVALVPFFVALENRSSGEAFGYAYFAGVVFFIQLGYWLTLVNVVGFVAMVAYLSLYFALFGWLSSPFLRSVTDFERNDIRRNVKTVFFIPAFWVLLEYVRGWMISGIPWGLIAYTQWENISFIQIAELTGVWGVSYFVLLTNTICFKLFRLFFPRKRDSADGADYGTHRAKLFNIYAATLVLSFLIVGVYGWAALRSWDAWAASKTEKPKLRVAVVQGNIPQELKWDAKIKNIIFEKYKRLTLMSAVERADLIVWPETSFPGYFEDEPFLSSQLRSVVRQSRTEVLVGAPTLGNLERGLKFFNSAILFGADGEEKKRYSKVHLVPFGEYIPLEPALGFIRHFVAIGHFSPGHEQTLFEIRSRYQTPATRAKFGVLICYEDIFPDLVRQLRKNGADFLVNMTNDAWFGKTTAPYQHAQASVFRAVENRVPVVRSTNTGLSCFISAQGRIEATVQDRGVEIFVTGRRGHEIVFRSGRSFYTLFGDYFIALMVLLCLLAYKEKNRNSVYSRL